MLKHLKTKHDFHDIGYGQHVSKSVHDHVKRVENSGATPKDHHPSEPYGAFSHDDKTNELHYTHPVYDHSKSGKAKFLPIKREKVTSKDHLDKLIKDHHKVLHHR